MVPLAIYLVLRAGAPPLGAERALLEDLIGTNFEAEMSGPAGSCYTSIKASHDHIVSKQPFASQCKKKCKQPPMVFLEQYLQAAKREKGKRKKEQNKIYAIYLMLTSKKIYAWSLSNSFGFSRLLGGTHRL